MPTHTEVRTVPRVTLYVKDADNVIWERARKLASTEESLSTLVSTALSEYVERREREIATTEELEKKFDAVKLEAYDDANDRTRKLRFTGTCIYEGPRDTFDVYITKAGKFVLARGDSYPRYTSLEVFAEFEELSAELEGEEEALTAIAEEIGRDYFEEIE